MLRGSRFITLSSLIVCACNAEPTIVAESGDGTTAGSEGPSADEGPSDTSTDDTDTSTDDTDTSTDDTDTSTDDTDTSTDDTDTSTDDTDTSTDDTDTSTDDTGDPGPECGDGVLDLDELCDDGNAVDDDACSNSCTLAACGDAVVQLGAGETCDLGIDNGPSATCTPDCLTASCGDGWLWSEEHCEDGNLDGLDGCNAHCLAPATLRWTHSFEWDDGPLDSVVGPDGSIYIASAEDWLARFDHDLELSAWIVEDPKGFNAVAWHPDGLLVVRRGGNHSELAAYDAEDGDELWSLELGSSPDLQGVQITVDGLGNIVVARGFKHEGGGQPYDVMLTSFDAGGGEQWSKLITEPTMSPGVRVAADEAGNIFVDHKLPTGWQLARFDAAGQLIWEHFTPEEWAPTPFALAAADGRLARVGYAHTIGEGDDPTHIDVWIELRDSSGEVLWTRVHDGPADDWNADLETAVDVGIDAAGNVAVLALTQHGDLGEGVWLARYDQLGALLWDRAILDGLERSPNTISIAPDGDLLVSLTVEWDFLELAAELYSFAP